MAKFYESINPIIGDECLFIDRQLSPNETLYAEWNSSCHEFGFIGGATAKATKHSFVLTKNDVKLNHEILANFGSLKLVKLE